MKYRLVVELAMLTLERRKWPRVAGETHIEPGRSRDRSLAGRGRSITSDNYYYRILIASFHG